ncbi:MAG TPA: hypothetical protein VKA21_13385, partial [Candidatus Binatia bacterium]|nr:hypothetical protein [Candidatus Binatia bacterium]
MAPRRRAALLLACLLAAAAARSAGAGTGDGLCDAKESTPTTCVIVADASVPDGTTLTFDLPEVELRSKLTVAFAGRCTVEGATACASDGDCVPPARCDRTGRLTVQAAEKITIDGRGQIVARSQAVVGDEVGPPGGTVILEAHDVTVEGTVVVVADGATGVPAGHGGRIEVHADGSVVIEPGGRLDASTARGGCGGTIVVAQPISMVAGGTVNVDGATVGGTIALTARSYMSIPGTLQASNTNGDLASRPACEDGRPSGSIALAASRLHFSGSAKARGREGAGGVVRFDAERSVILDSAVGTTPISVFGGDTDAFTTGGGVFVSASGGNVELRHGPIEADGLGSGLGSDAGLFSISAAAGRYCDATGAACAGPADCAPGEPCLEAGGDVLVAAPVSAAGGAGGGSGCIACEIRGTGTVTVSGPIDVGGGKRQGVGGKVTIVAGMDLAVGPGMLGADAADGGDVILIAGERAGAARDVSGTLRIAGGTEVHADAFLDNGIGGHIQMEGCEVAAEAESTVRSEGGPVGGSAGIEVVARNRLTIGPLATFSALPDGVLSLTYGADVSVAPDAVLQPPTPPVPDPSLPPCPACGNGVIEPLEDCDGRGTCALPSEVCLPPGADGACTCRDTCGTVPGVQAGEDCDGADLDGQTCASLGFGKGKLACASDCRFDTTQCTEDVCGDGRVGPTEACDPGGIDGAPPAFGETTCESLGHPGGGTLACTADCATVVTRPHCAANVAVACTSDDACGSDGPCVGGCVACGNGFVDPGEA